MLKEYRGKMSLREASERIGISHTYLYTLEKGVDPRNNKERMPSIDTIRKISKVYNINTIDMLMDMGYVSKEDVEEHVHNNYLIE